MDEYNWDDWDSQASEYLNSDAYQSPETLDMSQFEGGGQSYAPNSVMSNLGYVDQSSPEMSQIDWGNVPAMDMFPESSGQQMDFNMSLDPNGAMARLLQGSTASNGMSTPSLDLPNNQGMDFSGIQNTLAQIFQGGSNNKLLSTGLSALISGAQNKRKAAQLQQLAQTLRTSGDPFGSQRAQYQQALSQAVQDPYSAPIVKNQVDALAQAQAIKDAAAGRRSNSMTSAPQLLAEQAKVAQNYINSLYTPAGANISPNMSGYTQASMAGTQAGVDGYLSPLAAALGYNQKSSSNNEALLAALQKALGGQ